MFPILAQSFVAMQSKGGCNAQLLDTRETGLAMTSVTRASRSIHELVCIPRGKINVVLEMMK